MYSVRKILNIKIWKPYFICNMTNRNLSALCTLYFVYANFQSLQYTPWKAIIATFINHSTKLIMTTVILWYRVLNLSKVSKCYFLLCLNLAKTVTPLQPQCLHCICGCDNAVELLTTQRQWVWCNKKNVEVKLTEFHIHLHSLKTTKSCPTLLHTTYSVHSHYWVSDYLFSKSMYVEL